MRFGRPGLNFIKRFGVQFNGLTWTYSTRAIRQWSGFSIPERGGIMLKQLRDKIADSTHAPIWVRMNTSIARELSPGVFQTHNWNDVCELPYTLAQTLLSKGRAFRGTPEEIVNAKLHLARLRGETIETVEAAP